MISVIVPTYNRAHLIERALKSILNQSYRDFEIIVVDDCSTDDTERVVNSIICEKLHYIKLKENSGACKARNEGIKVAKGEYIAFLDSDDEWNNNKLKIQYDYLISKNADIVVCNYNYERKNRVKVAINKKESNITLDELLYSNCVTTGSILTKKSVLDDVGYFDETMPRYQDWELVLRIVQKYKIDFMKEPLLTLHFQKNSISTSTSKEKKYLALEKIYKKNKIYFEKNKYAEAHIFWSMGMYSLYNNDVRMDLLKKGVYDYGVNYKRLAIYFLIQIGFKKIIKIAYSKNH